MQKIVEYLGSGKIYKYPGKSAVSLSIVDFKDITNTIVPLFNENPIIGTKLHDYIDWCKIHSLMINRSHLTVEGINSIRFILALIVLLSHFENPLVNELKSSEHLFLNLTASVMGILFNGVAAVIAFFIISGYVIHQSSKDKEIFWKNFLFRRYLRILLPLIVIYFLGSKYNHPEKSIAHTV
ncbi:MAG: hypothetical protein EOP45_19335 [Sphingobacteriaceae bacterium]|nr:MAG: hypothetical protein EOP45_19335 [Sphingobacteriaceae bacterium]